VAQIDSFKFSSDGTATAADVQTASINYGTGVVSVGSTSMPLALVDEFRVALDAAEAEDASDGEVSGSKILGDEGDYSAPFTVSIVVDASGALTGIRMPNQTTDWTTAKARDFVELL